VRQARKESLALTELMAQLAQLAQLAPQAVKASLV
jgi:hypothetical protein